MAENEIVTQKNPQMQLFSQLMEGILKKLERYCATACLLYTSDAADE